MPIIKKIVSYISVSLILSGLLAIVDIFFRVVVLGSLNFNLPIVWDCFSRTVTVIFLFILIASILPAVVSFFIAKKRNRASVVSAVSLGFSFFLYLFILLLVPINREYLPGTQSLLGILSNIGFILVLLTICSGVSFLLYRLFKRHINKPNDQRNIILGCITLCIFVLTVVGYFAYDTFPSSNKSVAIDQPNILIISTDTLRRDHLSVYSTRYVNTPNIDKFASKSIVYTNSYTNSPWTMPALYTMLSSKYPSVHDIHKFRLPNSGIKVFPQILAEDGYNTEAIISNPLVRDDFNFNKGFYRYNTFDEAIHFGNFKVVSLCRQISLVTTFLNPPACQGENTPDDATPWVTDMLISKLDKDRKRPFFIWAHYMDPHWPYLMPDEYIDDPSLYLSSLTDNEIEMMLSEEKREPKSERIMKLFYEAETRYVDDALGEVFDVIEQRGYYEDTLIIFTSDHGEELFEHGTSGHALTHYKEVMDIPFIVHIPGKNSKRVNTPVSLIDIMPTILEYIGISTSENLSGSDIFNGLESDRSRDIYFDGIINDASVISLRRGDYTLTRYGENEYEYKLIDNRDDVLEDDVTDKYPDIIESYRTALDQWYKETAEEASEYEDHKTYKEDKSHKDNLKNLGYLE